MGACFVTGTDVGVGTTLVASAIVHLAGATGHLAVGMKPVAPGATFHHGEWHNDEVDRLAAAGSLQLPDSALCPYILAPDQSPEIAAHLAGITLAPECMLEALGALQVWADVVVVDGVGGFRMPLAAGYDSADLAQAMDLPVVLAVGLRPGCLNHALLTAEAIVARGLRLAGWVANTIDPALAQPEMTLASLRRWLSAPCLGVVPRLDGSGPGMGPLARRAADHLSREALLGLLALGGRVVQPH
jgi:dethiobiotin synthetase